jgi:hydrogenase nickel incorporation protein HypB
MADVRLIEIKEDILSDNKDLADEIRDTLRRHKVFMLNLMASPGGGKTSLIINTIRQLKGTVRIAVIEGDIDSVVDAEKVVQEGIPAVQLKTGGFCHLDASMIKLAINEIDLKGLDLVIIENIGNLVCPAEFDTGAHKQAMILSVPEGDDKPLKYPMMFSICDVLVINKIDYLGIADFDMDAAKERVFKLNPGIKIIEVSCKTGQGIEEWTRWVEKELKTYQNSTAP